MADENSPETTPAPETSTPKNETVRITLPPQSQQDVPVVKRETVHIGVVPKKETTRIGATPPPAASAPPPPARPPMMPPRPPAAPMAPSPAGAKPSIPPIVPKPAAPAAAPKATAFADPVTIKAAPKKETARIQVAPTQKLPPQATVRLSQPSQSLTAGPGPAIRTAAAPAATTEVAGADPIVNALSWAAVAISLAAAVFTYMAYSA